jgi:hypothetical protein
MPLDQESISTTHLESSNVFSIVEHSLSCPCGPDSMDRMIWQFSFKIEIPVCTRRSGIGERTLRWSRHALLLSFLARVRPPSK